MAIQRWNPVRDLRRLQEQLNRMFDDTLARSSGSLSEDAGRMAAWKPPMDLFEEPGRYVMRADLPGVSAGDVKIQVIDGQLVLSGERGSDGGVERESYLRAERPAGRFSAEVALPPSVDATSIRAAHRNGVLEISLPKKEASIPSRIRVATE